MTPAETARANVGAWKTRAMVLGAAATVAAAIAVLLDPDQFLRSYLYAYLFWTGMGIGCLAILMMHHVVGGRWGMVIRRLCEAGARTIPLSVIFFIPIVLGLSHLYPWDRPEAASDANIQSKAAYLNVSFFLARAALYFVVWSAYAIVLSRHSAEQDRTGDPRIAGRMRTISAPGLVVLTITATFAFIDWIMSLEPHWFSTIYGAMFLIGEMLEAFAFVIAVILILAKIESIGRYVSEQHVHDLGNMMFAFMVLWAYLSFSQFLIIWAGNLPEEIPWYVARLNGGWGGVALTIVIFHFALPFVLLLMRGVKRRADRLLRVCFLLLAIRLVDVYWITEPAFTGEHLRIRWPDAILPLAIGGWWLAYFFWQLGSRPLLPTGDERLRETPHETVVY